MTATCIVGAFVFFCIGTCLGFFVFAMLHVIAAGERKPTEWDFE